MKNLPLYMYLHRVEESIVFERGFPYVDFEDLDILIYYKWIIVLS